ncbi:hypothetical protein [Flavobacterium suncheonense]|uniref:Uncharacterized protein n=1 Tax=Flavobacterium suncheonense GH29-5 = DSM 17707 TaxID=1121899 RepID=A0A0A2MMR6_9FLAO|nr:hypothetical protein [Flavobacterium suncheonense]KGO89575.1 hypothetical protein Q764_07335 [Flavobacterium suncheonense GH29-5 = DSM 17707]
MNSVKNFIDERNQKIRDRYHVLKADNKRNETLEIVASEFGLSTSSISTIVFRKNTKNRAN